MSKIESGVVRVGNIPENQATRGTRPLRQCLRHHNYRRVREFDFNDYAACRVSRASSTLLEICSNRDLDPRRLDSNENRRLTMKVSRLFDCLSLEPVEFDQLVKLRKCDYSPSGSFFSVMTGHSDAISALSCL